ncbi:MAG: preprotein translocase subunit SecE [Mycobacterium sp.]|nr:preprotein translocase subunit SecE [Mycobacterium sp.]
MSDERDSVDGDAADGAVQDADDRRDAVTPPRPTGKRSRQRALAGTAVVDDVVKDDTEDTEDASAADKGGKVKAPKKKAASGASRNPIAFVFNYLKQVVAELRKVIWPNRKQMVSYTTVVLVFLAFMVALIGGVDLGLAKLVLWVFG